MTDGFVLGDDDGEIVGSPDKGVGSNVVGDLVGLGVGITDGIRLGEGLGI